MFNAKFVFGPRNECGILRFSVFQNFLFNRPVARSILYQRFVRKPLEEALEDTPVVLIHGPRQCGKTTLARMVGDAAGYEYITFDDDVQLAAAKADPVGFVDDLSYKTIL